MTSRSPRIGFEGILADEKEPPIGFEHYDAEQKEHLMPAYPIGTLQNGIVSIQ